MEDPSAYEKGFVLAEFERIRQQIDIGMIDIVLFYYPHFSIYPFFHFFCALWLTLKILCFLLTSDAFPFHCVEAMDSNICESSILHNKLLRSCRDEFWKYSRWASPQPGMFFIVLFFIVCFRLSFSAYQCPFSFYHLCVLLMFLFFFLLQGLQPELRLQRVEHSF